MDEPEVYTEVRGANVFKEEELKKALHSYSRHFKYNEAPEDDHQYFLFRSLPYLIVVNYFPKGHPYLEPNIVITFTSNSIELNKRLAARFAKKADLELLTEHECKRLAEFTNSAEEKAFRDLVEIRRRGKTKPPVPSMN